MAVILAIGAHYDDVEIGVAGVLCNHVMKKDTVYIFVLCGDEFRTGNPAIRKKEQLKAMNEMGIPMINLIVARSTDSDTDVIKRLDVLNPDVIYTPYAEDTHQDHRRCSMIGQSVGRKRYITTMFYAGASAHSFNPTVFVPIDFLKKTKVLDHFVTQIQCGAINITRIKYRERYWGTIISDLDDYYAEGFVIHKMKLNI